MLEKQVNGLTAYCKMSGFKDKLIKSLSLILNKFKVFLSNQRKPPNGLRVENGKIHHDILLA